MINWSLKISKIIFSEFFTYSQNLQQPEKENFLEMLINRGILNAIEVLLDSKFATVRTLGAELICQITELNQQPSIVREHILKTVRNNPYGVSKNWSLKPSCYRSQEVNLLTIDIKIDFDRGSIQKLLGSFF